MNEKLLKYFNEDELASSTWEDKYAKKDQEGNSVEITPDDMHRRMSIEFQRIERKHKESPVGNLQNTKLSSYGRERHQLTEESIFQMFKDFKYIIPQGRVMAGLGNTGSFRSLSNCLRLPPPKDSYSSIMYTDNMLVNSAKRGCGYGLGLSGIRPRGAGVSNAANTSTGAASFMERFSNSTREVAQEGRRGACLEDMSIFHPDILEFIQKKKDRTKVTGANISVKLYDEFMEAVEKDADFMLRWPCDMDVSKIKDDRPFTYGKLYPFQQTDKKKSFYKIVKAKEYWEEIIENAHENAEPGLFFWDRVTNYDPSHVYEKFKIDGTNACGEQPMAIFDTCRLILLNLYSFVKNPFTDKAELDYGLLYKMAYEQTRLGDNLVDLEIEYIDRIIKKIKSDDIPDKEKAIELHLWKSVRKVAINGRRVGCGITALGDMFAALGLKYTGPMALATAESVMRIKMKAEMDCMNDLSVIRGPFKGWDADKEFNMKKGSPVSGKNDFYSTLLKIFPEEAERMCENGRRNINWSTIAPAGSTSMIAKTQRFCNLSSGCEPTFMTHYIRKKKINPSQEGVRVDFTDQSGDTFQEFPVMMGAFKEWLMINYLEPLSEDLMDRGVRTKPLNFNVALNELTADKLDELFKRSPWFESTAAEIPWLERIKMQSLLQKYTTSAISSTLNLRKDVPKSEVNDIYQAAWKYGLKGVTIYRDGCRTGILTNENSTGSFKELDALKRPNPIKAKTFYSKSLGESYFVIVGLVENKPYEVFIDNKHFKYSKEGIIDKEAQGKYVFKNGGEPIEIKNFMTPEQQAITRLVSMGLRHHVKLIYIVEQLQKIDGDMFGFARSLARVLKRFIPDGEKPTVKCQNPDCTGDGTNVIYEEGCAKCLDCNSSKCG